MLARLAHGRFYYGWVIVAALAVTETISWAFGTTPLRRVVVNAWFVRQAMSSGTSSGSGVLVRDRQRMQEVSPSYQLRTRIA
jgi:hypothetical protein